MQILILLLLAWTGIVTGQTFGIGGSSARSPDIILDYQNISICPENIRVISEYINRSKLPITETFVFTTPMNIKVASQPVHAQLVEHAVSYDGRDISAHLRLLGLPFDPIVAMHTIDASSNRDSLISKLLALRLIDPKESIPNWALKSHYYWQHTFPADSSIIIEHSFKPNITIKNVKLKNISTLKKAINFAIHWNKDDSLAATNLQTQIQKYILNIDAAYCPSKNDYQAIAMAHRLNGQQKPLLETKALSLTYNSEDLWSKPIKRFILTIDSSSNTYPILCWHDKLQREANNSLRFNADDYVPMQNISVLYIEK